MIVVEHEQGSPEWHAARMGIPTSSEFSRIVTPSQWKPCAKSTWMSFAAELIDQSTRPLHQEDFQGNKHTERGNAFEDEARSMYEMITGNTVEQVGLCLSECKLYGASPDGLVGDDGGIEIKCPDGKKHALTLLKDEVPAEHMPQIHGNMAVTGRCWWDFISYCPGYRPFIKRVDRTGKTTDLAVYVVSFCDYKESCAAKVLGVAA